MNSWRGKASGSATLTHEHAAEYDMASARHQKSYVVWDLGRPGKARGQRVLAHLVAKQYDLLVLAKCRSNSLPSIVEGLENAGYTVLLGGISLEPSLVVASRSSVQEECAAAPTGFEHRWIPFSLESGVKGLAVHIPYAGELHGLEGKRRFWESVLSWGRQHQNECAMILGVFNTGLPADSEGERFSLGSCMQELLDQGWVDCWRGANPGLNDFGWFSTAGNGFRLDHCFCSPGLAQVLSGAEFDHQTRVEGLSSSAPLIVRLQVATSKPVGN